MATLRVTDRELADVHLWLGLIVSGRARCGRRPGADAARDRDAARTLAPLAISEDGHTVIFRGTALAALKIRVEPEAGTFGKGTIELRRRPTRQPHKGAK
jgi:hypothetical protein